MHSCVYVFIPKEGDEGTLVAKALRPFNEELEVPPYKVYLNDGEIAAMAKHYDIRADDVTTLATNMEDWSGGPGGIDSEGLFVIKTWNPNGKWDWYEIGGRWDGRISGNVTTAKALLKKRNLADVLPHCMVTPDRKWHEEETFISECWTKWRVERKPDNVWLDEVKQALHTHSDYRVVCVDIHS
jgi:hypothetical protein